MVHSVKTISPGKVPGHSHMNLNVHQPAECFVLWAWPTPNGSRSVTTTLTNRHLLSSLLNSLVLISFIFTVYSYAFFVFISFPYKFSVITFYTFILIYFCRLYIFLYIFTYIFLYIFLYISIYIYYSGLFQSKLPQRMSYLEPHLLCLRSRA